MPETSIWRAATRPALARAKPATQTRGGAVASGTAQDAPAAPRMSAQAARARSARAATDAPGRTHQTYALAGTARLYEPRAPAPSFCRTARVGTAKLLCRGKILTAPATSQQVGSGPKVGEAAVERAAVSAAARGQCCRIKVATLHLAARTSAVRAVSDGQALVERVIHGQTKIVLFRLGAQRPSARHDAASATSLQSEVRQYAVRQAAVSAAAMVAALHDRQTFSARVAGVKRTAVLLP